MKNGRTLASGSAPDAQFAAAVTIVLDVRVATLVVDDAAVEAVLPADLREVRHMGYYTNGARSNFGLMKVTQGGGQPNPK